MIKNAASLLVAALAASSSAYASDDQLVRIGRSGSTNTPILADANLSGNGISASFKFLPTLDNKGLQMLVSASGLTQGTKYPYHIHEKVVPSDGNCTGTGGHLDPFKIKAAAGDKYKCDAANPQSTCELGDLAGIFGPMEAGASGSISGNFVDPMLAFYGESGILGHSIVIHGPDSARLACANITGYVLSSGSSSQGTDQGTDQGTGQDSGNESNGADQPNGADQSNTSAIGNMAAHDRSSENESSTNGASRVGVASALAILAAAIWL